MTKLENLDKAVGKQTDKYGRIREGILASFKNNFVTPIQMYRIANDLDTLAVEMLEDYLWCYIDTNRKQRFTDYESLIDKSTVDLKPIRKC